MFVFGRGSDCVPPIQIDDQVDSRGACNLSCHLFTWIAGASLRQLSGISLPQPRRTNIICAGDVFGILMTPTLLHLQALVVKHDVVVSSADLSLVWAL